MKSRILGVLCLVTFALCSLAHLQVDNVVAGPEANPIRTIHRQSPGSVETKGKLPPDVRVLDVTTRVPEWAQWSQREDPHWPWQEAEKAISLAIVGWEGCPPCKRMKREVIPVLVAAGYDVEYFLTSEWGGQKVTRAPTLFYLNSSNTVIKKETGYQTVRHIKQYLKK